MSYHALGGELFASEDRVADGINDLRELSGDGENRNKVDVEHGEVGQQMCGLQHCPRLETCDVRAIFRTSPWTSHEM